MSGILSLENKEQDITDEEDNVFFKLDYIARNEINGIENTTSFGDELSTKPYLRCPKRYDDYLASIYSKFKDEVASESSLMDDIFPESHDSGTLIFISNEKQTVSDGYTGTDFEKSHTPLDDSSSMKRKCNLSQRKDQVHEIRRPQTPVFKSKLGNNSQVLWRRGKAGSSIDDSDTSTDASGFLRCSIKKKKTLFGDSEMLINCGDKNVEDRNTEESTVVAGEESISKTHSIDDAPSSLKKNLDNCRSCKIPILPIKSQKTVRMESPGKGAGDCREQNIEETSCSSTMHSSNSQKEKSRNQPFIHYRQLSDSKLTEKRQTKKCVKCFLCCGKGVFPLTESIRAGLTYPVNPCPRMHCPRALEPCAACASRADGDKDSSMNHKKDYSRMTKVERKKELQRIYGMRLSDRQARANQAKLQRPEWVF